MSFQFVHLQAYSRKGDSQGRSTSYVLAETRRDPASCLHVPNPMPPTVVYGTGITELEETHDAAADAARTVPKAGKPRRIRTDQQTLMTVVASHPYLVSDVVDDEGKKEEIATWEKLTIDWLWQLYGDKLASVIRHTDEPHWHLHAYILPDRSTMRASALHPGQLAKKEVMSTGEKGGGPKELNKLGDAAYRRAMRTWQDLYHDAVGVHCGLTRLGPARRRLTRAEWQAERTQARALQSAEARAADVTDRIGSLVAQQKDEAAAMLAKAEADAKKVRANAVVVHKEIADAKAELNRRTENAREATERAREIGRRALEEQKKARSMIARVRHEARSVREATARLQRLPALLRSLWDGFRRSKIHEETRAGFEAEMDRLKLVADQATDRVGRIETEKRVVEERTRQLERSLSETALQRDVARREVERLRPTDPDVSIAPAPRHFPKPS